MTFLWAAGAPVTTSETHHAVAPELAYTTVMTVLGRLHRKGLLDRATKGRGYVYWPVQSEAAHRAYQMTTVLGHSADRSAVLNRFVGELGQTDIDELRRLLGSGRPDPEPGDPGAPDPEPGD